MAKRQIDYKHIKNLLEDMLWYAEGRGFEPNEYMLERLCTMRYVIAAELVFASKFYATDAEWEEAARSVIRGGDDMEVYSDAIVSIGDDDGAYVQTWVWVSGAEIREQLRR